jgi:glycosyltransferase involved in cell wall biosynthesis
MKKIISYSIVIPAYNEEKNIDNLISDILNSYQNKILKLMNIYIISDASTDNTNNIVKKRAVKNKLIKLIINKKRIGKAYSLNKAFKQIKSDYIILFDADVRLKNRSIFNLLKPIYLNKVNSQYIFLAGNPMPLKKKQMNLTEKASMFSWYLIQEIKKRYPESIYSAHGRILALSKKLYSSLEFKDLSTPGDDQYIYLFNKLKKGTFFYCKDAEVYYKLPQQINDYLKQNIRFRKAKNFKKKLFSRIDIELEFKIKKQYSLLLSLIKKKLKYFVCWFFLYSIGYLKYLIEKIQNRKRNFSLWEIANSTK